MSAINRLIAGPFGGVLLHPWYDPVALAAILKFYLPMSRAWAAASDADGDVDKFAAGLGAPVRRTAGLAAAVRETARRRHVYLEADRHFSDAAFGSSGDVARRMQARVMAADAWMGARSKFLPMVLGARVPAVRRQLETEADVMRRHGARRADAANAFTVADGAVATSRAIDGADRVLSWLKFPCRDGAHAGWARVEAPRGVAAVGTVIFLHGILMEREFFSSLYDYAPPFLDASSGAMRIIQPEGPWHGRRMVPGWYGGEPLLGNPTGGLLDYFAAHVVEVGRLIAWARERFGGPVAVAGVSLGALTSQLVASAAKHWPAAARPDAALLITTNESMSDIAFRGSLAGGLGFPAALKHSGWSEPALDAWRPLLEPAEPALAPERIVAVLGYTDAVTPIAGGERLVARWALPAANVFRRPGGHFSAAFSLLRDDGPIARLKRVMTAGA
jgi:hypothetical protein